MSPIRFNDARDWFLEARFGMFIHWGIYSLNAWHEQEFYRRPGMSRREYRQLASRFNPQAFNPDAWVDLAMENGMRYLVLTAKHIDGFCMFDSAVSDFKITNTPFKRDIVGMLAEACRRRDMHFGVYFSCMDNCHKHYPRSGKKHETGAEPGDEPDYARYMQFVRAQVRELCGNYGKIDVFWWDGNYTAVIDHSINSLIRGLQPSCVINDRGWDQGDFGTPERDYDQLDCIWPFAKLTEACESIGSQSWGFRKDEDYFRPLYLMRRMDMMFSKGANYLLNAGPDSSGVIPAGQQNVLAALGRWHKKVNEAWTGVKLCCDLSVNGDIILTSRENVLYVHLVKELKTNAVILDPLNVLPRRATLLNNNAPVACDLNPFPYLFRRPVKTALRLYGLPLECFISEVAVIKLEFDRPVEKLV